jgi:hypothetical protein
MTRDQILAIVSTVVAEELVGLKAELMGHVERAVATKPLPPFVPPPVWTEGRHCAGVTVRHRNGLFLARRDTEGEPGKDDGWLPLLVGLAGLDLHWEGERTVALRAMLSDGTCYVMIRTFAVPIVRGYWSADADYEPGDRVFRFGEFHALQASKGIEPGSAGSEGRWLKVGGKTAKPEKRAFALTNEGELTESGHVIGSLKPLITEVLDDLLAKHSAVKSH